MFAAVYGLCEPRVTNQRRGAGGLPLQLLGGLRIAVAPTLRSTELLSSAAIASTLVGHDRSSQSPVGVAPSSSADSAPHVSYKSRVMLLTNRRPLPRHP